MASLPLALSYRAGSLNTCESSVFTCPAAWSSTACPSAVWGANSFWIAQVSWPSPFMCLQGFFSFFFFPPSVSSQGWALHCIVLSSSVGALTRACHLCAFHKSYRNSVYLTLWHPCQMPLKLPNTLKLGEERGKTDRWVGRIGGNIGSCCSWALLLPRVDRRAGPDQLCRAPRVRLISG